MKIAIDVVDNSEKLVKKIESGIVPFAVCLSPTEKVSKRVKSYLDQYYCENIDKKGQRSYYCNFIDPYKCKGSGYGSVVFEDGRESAIRVCNLQPTPALKGKYVVCAHLANGQKFSSVDLTKKVRLKVAKIKKDLNPRQNDFNGSITR